MKLRQDIMHLDEVLSTVDKLDLAAETRNKAHHIFQRSMEIHRFTGFKRSVIMASSVYIAALIHGEKRTQQVLAKAFHVTEPSIRRAYQLQLDILNLEQE